MNNDKYKPQEVELKWMKKWEKDRLFYAVAEDTKRKKYYALVEFPYPSGEGLHLGHTFTNTVLDVFARKKRMDGFNVFHPMGWDAFGLPTENYAIKTGIHPAVVTKENTNRFREQDKRLGFSYTWDREVNTTDPNYYQWTQWIFIQLFKHGLAYKAEKPVGWCPDCKIILANEEIVGGKCERCGATAEYRKQKQWLLRITAYADRLADELDLVDYPEYVKKSQRDWIGRKEWIDITYPIEGTSEKISVSTTRPDTNFGATFIVVAPEYPLIQQILNPKSKIRSNLKIPNSKIKELQNYLNAAKKKSERERISEGRKKTGVFTGLYAVNQLNNYQMPIWVTDFVLPDVGTGAVVGVPGHDLRDFEFAKQFALPVIRVVVGEDGDTSPITKKEQVQEEEGAMVNSEFLNGLDIHEATIKIMDYIEKEGWGKRTVRYHLRDWIFSRQHYWGEPIPMVYCQICAKKGITWWKTKAAKDFKPVSKQQLTISKSETAGWFPLPEEELPLKLPEVERYQPTETGESPLANIKTWVKTSCPHCGGPARRETDTMPNWAGSSWYFLRYCDPKNNQQLAINNKLEYWLPVDLYLGGAEHTTLHLLYSRFWHKFLFDLGTAPGKEPYAARRQHGVILGPDGYRMSKSRGNIVNPEDIVNKYGADTLRMYLMFMGPYDSTMPWSDEGVEGIWRFLNRIWRIYHDRNRIASTSEESCPASAGLPPSEVIKVDELRRKLHRLIQKVGDDIDNLKHNTAIAALMEFLNAWYDGGTLSKKDAGAYLHLLAPFAPFLAEELWQQINQYSIFNIQYSIHSQPWPKYDPKLAKEEQVTIIIQVNGKMRGEVRMKNVECRMQNKIEERAKKDEKVVRYLEGKTIRKTIFVPGKLINFVTGN